VTPKAFASHDFNLSEQSAFAAKVRAKFIAEGSGDQHANKRDSPGMSASQIHSLTGG